MKTVSAKLDSKLHNQFMELCNNEGKCQSEFLRDMIQNLFENYDDDEVYPQDLQLVTPKPIVTLIENKPAIIPKIGIVWK